MRYGYPFGYGSLLRSTSLSSGPSVSPDIDAEGWRATIASPTDLSFSPITVERAGFTTAGTATTITDTVLLTKRVRLPYPDQTTFTANQVALSRLIYMTDSIAGATNGSTILSPKPKMRWLMPRRTLHGNSMRVSVEAMHPDARLGQQIASARVRGVNVANPASVTPWLVIGAPSVSTICEDAHDVMAFEDNLDLTALPDGLFYLECEGRPWIGDAASVRSSEDAGLAKDFGRIYFTKDVARFAARPVAYINTAGNNTTGVFSTNPATAAANKFATLQGALENLKDEAATGGNADGCIIYFDDGTHPMVASGATLVTPQLSAAITLTRSPESTSRAAVIVEFGAAAYDPHLGINLARNGTTLSAPLTEAVMNFEDISVRRGAPGSPLSRSATSTAVVPMIYQFINVNFDDNNLSARFISTLDTRAAFFGCTITNAPLNGTAWFGGNANNFVILRGVQCADLNGSTFDGFSVAGCSFNNPGAATFQPPFVGTMISYSSFYDVKVSVLQESWDSGTVIERIGLLEVLMEYTSASTSNPLIVLAGTSGSSRGQQYHHVTLLGAEAAGRFNVAYDNQSSAPGNEQTHENVSIVGGAFGEINTKGGWFRNDPAGDDGNFAHVHGVGHEGIYALWRSVEDTVQLAYAGLNNDISTLTTNPQDPENDVFVDYQATTAPGLVYAAGAGNGDYRPAPGSPLLGKVTTRLVSGRSLDGVVRTLPAASGAYA